MRAKTLSYPLTEAAKIAKISRLNWVVIIRSKIRPLFLAEATRTAGSNAEFPRNAAATSVALLIEFEAQVL
jgi:hypothetical protein